MTPHFTIHQPRPLTRLQPHLKASTSYLRPRPYPPRCLYPLPPFSREGGRRSILAGVLTRGHHSHQYQNKPFSWNDLILSRGPDDSISQGLPPSSVPGSKSLPVQRPVPPLFAEETRSLAGINIFLSKRAETTKQGRHTFHVPLDQLLDFVLNLYHLEMPLQHPKMKSTTHLRHSTTRHQLLSYPPARSEERRVGKECPV